MSNAVASELDLEESVTAQDDSSCSLLETSKPRFLQLADDFTFLNPHVKLTVQWGDECLEIPAGASNWTKWSPSDPTPAHWYDLGRFERLIAAYIAQDADSGKDRTVREFVAEFRSLKATAKQKAVLEECGLARTKLSELAGKNGIDRATAEKLLGAMKKHTKPIPPRHLGIIGKEHLAARFAAVGCEMESFKYGKREGYLDDVPWVLEAAFAWCPDAEERRIITGVNFSPSIGNPFRTLGSYGGSLDSVLEVQRAGRDEPVVLLIHLAYPRAEFSDHGKTTLVIERW